MSNVVATRNGHPPATVIENVVIRGDLSKLTDDQRTSYYMTVCRSVGLNPLTKPFEYITLNGRLTLYALRNCTDQLRQIHKISVADMTETERDGVFIVTCKVVNDAGRTDMAKGAVNIAKLQGEALANALMKAETKAKRRATLSICGLSLLDETEVEDIPAPVKALPKKDARPVYDKFQAEIKACATYDALKQWMTANAERISVLPTDWQDILRAHCHERLVELKQLGANDQPRGEDEAPADPEKFLKWADGVLAAVTDPGMLEPTYNFRIDPHMQQLLPPDQDEVLGVFRKHEARLAQ